MIWLIGYKGMLGTELSKLLDKNNFAFFATDKELDVTDPRSFEKCIEKQQPNWIINCAAYTAVDKAEDDAEGCRLLNTVGPANIASFAQNARAKLIHISTDYVFDGKGITENGTTRPYREDDTTDPIGVYGLSKRNGELAVLEHNPSSYILRTAWLYGKYGNNFVNTMLRIMNEREEIKVVNDQHGSPTWAFDLALAILTIIKAVDSGKEIPFGIYHYTNEGNINWFDFAAQIYLQGRELGHLSKDCTVKPCSSAEYLTKAKRPAYSILDKTKIKNTLGIEIPVWDASLREYLKIV